MGQQDNLDLITWVTYAFTEYQTTIQKKKTKILLIDLNQQRHLNIYYNINSFITAFILYWLPPD